MSPIKTLKFEYELEWVMLELHHLPFWIMCFVKMLTQKLTQNYGKDDGVMEEK